MFNEQDISTSTYANSIGNAIDRLNVYNGGCYRISTDATGNPVSAYALLISPARIAVR